MATSDLSSPPGAGGQGMRGVRSYVLRAGRLAKGQRRALTELAPQYVLPFEARSIEPAAEFGRNGPLVLDIGFGMGESTAQIAAASPEIDFLGVEVYPPGVGALLQRLHRHDIGNVRIVQHDAVEVLRHMISPESLSGAMIFFPDPWPKRRHQKRRLVQSEFVAMLSSRLAPGATLHLATDWDDYAHQMLQVLSDEASLLNAFAGFAPRPPYRPVTKFERRGERLGHIVRDLVFRKR